MNYSEDKHKITKITVHFIHFNKPGHTSTPTVMWEFSLFCLYIILIYLFC